MTTKALFTGAKVFALSTIDCMYNATVISSAGSGQRGTFKQAHYSTKWFYGPR
jgi:hypothetical protein